MSRLLCQSDDAEQCQEGQAVESDEEGPQAPSVVIMDTLSHYQVQEILKVRVLAGYPKKILSLVLAHQKEWQCL